MVRRTPSLWSLRYDKELVIDASTLSPTITWGTSPEDALPITGSVPDPAAESDPQIKAKLQRALDYMGLKPNQVLEGTPIDKVRTVASGSRVTRDWAMSACA